MEKFCVSCLSSSVSHDDISLFKFPKYLPRCRIWAEACGVEHLFEEYVKLGLPLSRTCYRVCSLHFENRMFIGTNKNKLHREAIPTMFLNNLIKSAENADVLNGKHIPKTSRENLKPSFTIVNCLDDEETVKNITTSDGKSQIRLENVQQFGIKQEAIDVVTVKTEAASDESINDIVACPAIKVEDMDSNYLSLDIKEEAIDIKDEYESSVNTSPGFSDLKNVHQSKALESPKGSSVSKVFTYKNPLQRTMYRCATCNFKTNYKGVIDVHLVTHETLEKSRLNKRKFKQKYKCTYYTIVKQDNLGRREKGT